MKTKRLSGDFSSQMARTNVSNLLTQLGLTSSSPGSSTTSPSLSPSSSSGSMAASATTAKVPVGPSVSSPASSGHVTDKAQIIEMTDMAEYRRSVIASYNVRFIGSIALRRRHTYPMLNWILTDLLYQSKCVGMDLSACITNCLMKENDNERAEGFRRLKQQLNQDGNQINNGLLVRMDMIVATTSEGNSYMFQMCNPVDGQCLLRHKFSRIFLLGKYYRQPSLFYYVHKSDEDVVNAVPSIYLFQAANQVQQSEICMKFNELRCKLQSSIDSSTKGTKSANDSKDPNSTYNPLFDLNNQQLNINNNCFEVRHIGSVLITQKRSTPSMIDRAADKLHREILRDYPSDSDSTLASDRSTTTESTAATTTTTTTATSNKPTVITTTGCARRQYRKNRFLVQVIEESNESNEPGCQSPPPPPQPPPPSLSEPTESKSWQPDTNGAKQEPNKTMLFIIGTMDICLISTENHRQVYSKVFANISHCSQGSKHADHFGVIVREPYVPPQPSGLDFTSMSQQPTTATVCQKGSSTNQDTKTTATSTAENYVLHIFQCQSESISNDLLCSLRQSFNNAYRHQQATAARATANAAGSKDNSPSSAAGSQENLSAPSAQTLKTNTSTNNTQYCNNCPMNWFHQLCLDIYGLDDVKIFAMLLHRIRHGSSERRWREYHTVFEYLQLDRLEQRVDLLIIMLKARVERMQRYHEIRDGKCRMDLISLYEQIEQYDPVLRQYQQQKSTLSLNRLEGLRMMARSSISNTFDAFRKRNRQSQSNENLQNNSATSSPSSSMMNLNSPTLFGGGSLFASMLAPEQSTNTDHHHQASNSVARHESPVVNRNNNPQSFQRRNTVADCGRDEESEPTFDTHRNPLRKSGSIDEDDDNIIQKHSPPTAIGSRSSTPQRKQPLMDIYIKTSSGNAMSSAQFSSMEELRQNLNQLLDPKLLATETENEVNDESQDEDHDDQVFEDNQRRHSYHDQEGFQVPNDENTHAGVADASSTIQMRHRLFRRIRKSLNQYKSNADIENLINNRDDLLLNVPTTSVPVVLSSPSLHQLDSQPQQPLKDENNRSCKARQLWQFAIRKQLQLLKQENVRKQKQQAATNDVQSNHSQAKSHLQESNAAEPQKPHPTTSVKVEANSNQQSVSNTGSCSLIDRVSQLYADIPAIETQSQLDMAILQWRKLIEMFENYCHNNPGQPQQQPQSSVTENERSIQTDAQNLHWWSHYERSIVDALRMGVPKEIRSTVWKFLAKYRRYRQHGQCDALSTPRTTRPSYRNLLKQLAIHQHAIFVDLGRTFPTVPYFAEPMGPGQLALYNLLKAYSLLDKEVEYCQGLSFVAGILLLHMNEDDAFDQLCYVLYECGLREQYKPSMDALQMQMYQLNRLLYDLNRPLYDHLDRMDISPTLYAAPSFLTVFASQLPIGFVARIFDLLMFYGMEAIFRVFYHLIDRIRDEILSTPIDDLERIMHLLRVVMLDLSADDMARFFERCLPVINSSSNPQSIYTMNSRLEQYRLEYQILQEEFVHLNKINKLAVEQKLQLKQKQQQQQLKPTQKLQPKIDSHQRNSIETIAATTSITTAVEQPSALCSAKLIECLRDENRRLREQMERLQKQNLQLSRQVEELQLQVRRQSH